MIKYFIRHYWRYLAMALAFATISFFLKSCEVKAESISDSVLEVTITYSATANGTQYAMNYDGFHSAGSGTQLYLHSSGQVTPIVMHSDSGNDINLWGRYTICGDGNFTGGWEQVHARNVNFVNTSIPCNFYGSSYVGKITFGTYQITNITVLGSDRYTFDTTIGTAFSGNASWQMIAHELSFNQFPTYYTESKVFDKLDTVISAINTLISQGNGASTITSAITNQTTAITNAQNNTTNAINGVNSTLNDSTISDPNNDLNEMESQVASNSVISDLLLLPVNMFQRIVNSIGGTCSSFSLGALFGTNLVFPCINIENLIGSALWTTIDILFCGIFILTIRKKFVDIFENITSLKDRGNEVE